MRISTIQQSFARDVVRLLLYMESKEFSYTFGEAFRTAEQAEIYAKNGKGIVNSLHCKRLAIDINLFDKNGNYLDSKESHAEFGAFWEKLHPTNRWGGGFKRVDSCHYERNE